MKKKLFLKQIVFFLILFCSLTTVSYAKSSTVPDLKWVPVEDEQLSMCYQLGDSIKVGFNFNLELLQIMAAYSCDFSESNYVPLDSPLNKKTKTYFSRYKKPSYAQDIKYYVTHDVVKKYINRQTEDILSYNKSLTEPIYPIKSTRTYGKTTFASNPADLVTILNTFKKYTNADKFFADHASYYEKISKEFRDQINVDYIANIESILGPRPENSTFTLILSPSMGGGTATYLTDTEGNKHYINITNTTGDIEDTLMVLYHEEIHNFLNPTLSKDWSHYSNNLFKDSLNDDVGSSNTFNDPHMVMLIDAHSSYNNLPSKIKNQISSSDYNAIAPDTSVAFKVENAQVVLVK